MSYIVPGDIPNNCRECPCGYITEGAFSDECRVLAREWEKDADSVRPNWCPLVEVKTPHGRLGDLDALYEEISNGNKAYNGIEGYDGEYPNIGNVDDCLDAIKYADTVIEAEDT